MKNQFTETQKEFIKKLMNQVKNDALAFGNGLTSKVIETIDLEENYRAFTALESCTEKV
ncbi:hypothetical protein [Roseivirga pacifica]|uniref:hypothetical protein n=1 Tax=Roseivirga pacifica TaxID=1267423 RepID=UPI003BAB11A2